MASHHNHSKKKTVMLPPMEQGSAEDISSFAGLDLALRSTSELSREGSNSLSPKALSHLVMNMRWFQEIHLGKDAKGLRWPIVRLPDPIFLDRNRGGPLFTALLSAFRYKSTQSWRNFDFTSPKRYDDNIVLFRRMERDLIAAGYLNRPTLYLDESAGTAAETLKLEQIAIKFGASITKDYNCATHIIAKDEEEMDTPDEIAKEEELQLRGDPPDRTYLRTVAVVPNNNSTNSSKVPMALVHWWFWPTSNDEWIPAADVDGVPESEEPPRAPNGAWVLSCKFLRDVARYNEWGLEVDYVIMDFEKKIPLFQQQALNWSHSATVNTTNKTKEEAGKEGVTAMDSDGMSKLSSTPSKPNTTLKGRRGGNGMNPRLLPTGEFNARGDKLKMTVFDGALRVPSMAQEIMSKLDALLEHPSSQKYDPAKNPLEFMAPSMDDSLSTLYVTELMNTAISTPVTTNPTGTESIPTSCSNATMANYKVFFKGESLQRIRGGGGEGEVDEAAKTVLDNTSVQTIIPNPPMTAVTQANVATNGVPNESNQTTGPTHTNTNDAAASSLEIKLAPLTSSIPAPEPMDSQNKSIATIPCSTPVPVPVPAPAPAPAPVPVPVPATTSNTATSTITIASAESTAAQLAQQIGQIQTTSTLPASRVPFSLDPTSKNVTTPPPPSLSSSMMKPPITSTLSQPMPSKTTTTTTPSLTTAMANTKAQQQQLPATSSLTARLFNPTTLPPPPPNKATTPTTTRPIIPTTTTRPIIPATTTRPIIPATNIPQAPPPRTTTLPSTMPNAIMNKMPISIPAPYKPASIPMPQSVMQQAPKPLMTYSINTAPVQPLQPLQPLQPMQPKTQTMLPMPMSSIIPPPSSTSQVTGHPHHPPSMHPSSLATTSTTTTQTTGGPNETKSTPKPKWYNPKSISPIEKMMLPEWFDNSASHRTPSHYRQIRETILRMVEHIPNRYLTATAIRKKVAGDAGSLLRLHTFLTTWRLINHSSQSFGDSMPVNAMVSKKGVEMSFLSSSMSASGISATSESKKRCWTGMDRAALAKSVVYHIQKKQKGMEEKKEVSPGADEEGEEEDLSIDWDVIAKDVGNGYTGTACQAEFLSLPLEEEEQSNEMDTTNTSSINPMRVTNNEEDMKEEIMREMLSKVPSNVLDGALHGAMKASNHDLSNAKNATIIAGLTLQATENARKEEEKVNQLLLEMLDQRMQKLENRMNLLDDVEAMLDVEQTALELERRDLYTARCRYWLGGGTGLG